MANVVSVLNNLINPEVMADIISAELPSKIKFANTVAVIDNTLVAQPGNTITVPVYAYIGDAADLAEGVEGESVLLSASTTQATVKKVFKSVDLTDEAVLSGYGDPAGEATKQLGMSVASKIDADVLTAIKTATLTAGAAGTAISFAGIAGACAKFADEEMGEAKYLYVSPAQYSELLVDPKFTPASAFGDRVLTSGVIGEIAGCQVIISNRLADGEALIVKPEAVKVYLKKNVSVEADRNIKAKITTIAVDEHYVAVLQDASKAVKYTVKPTV